MATTLTEQNTATAESLVNDRALFNSFVYLHWEEALEEIGRRQNEPALDAYIQKLLPNGIPEIMRGKKSMVLFRHIATPNHEVNRFVISADALDTLQPLILEYTKDLFNNRNDWKFSLAKMRFQKGRDKMGNPIIENKTIIDINASNNQPISEVHTHWGESLVDFHHDLFHAAFPHLKDAVFDLSDWLNTVGPTAKDYYKGFLALFLKDAILFENFLLDSKEYGFTSGIILPALLEIEAETGFRPLIVALEPTHIEGDQFWLSYPSKTIQPTENRLQQNATI